MIIKYLDWDSKFFNTKIGRINYNKKNEIKSLLSQARDENYNLIYLFCDENMLFEQEILKEYNGCLVDRKVIYFNNNLISKEFNFPVEEYVLYDVGEDLEQLTYMSGQYSRFRIDTHFDSNDFYRMYKTWITKSISKEMADKVFVIRYNNLITGMVTLKIIDNKGVIGLIAVSDINQGRGIGKTLLDACSTELLNRNIKTIEVATQIDNKIACRFYLKNGFSVKSITNIYHFWL